MRQANACSDNFLVQQAKKGNKKAYDQLLNRYHDKIRQTVNFYLNDNTNSHDLTQEVLLKVFRYLNSFKGECEFSTWLYKITQNTVKNYFRMNSLRLDVEEYFASQQTFTHYYSPELQTMSIELEELLGTVIANLSDELRQCYGMHLLEGQTYEDIARTMDCPIGTVRSRVFRARQLVREQITALQLAVNR